MFFQVSEQESKTSEVKSECALAVNDPRSPSVGISRTPMREVMRCKYIVQCLTWVFPLNIKNLTFPFFFKFFFPQ